jgi:hypothetical protein
LKEYSTDYEALAKVDPSVLNRKVPREAFSELINEIGGLLTEKSTALSKSPGPVRAFLDSNPVPGKIAAFLPDSHRAFCLGLNAIKQWVVAEQAAMDRYLLGAQARDLCREAFDHCLVTGDAFSSDVELHHPIRDGRPPIPLSKKGHALIEGQAVTAGDDPMEQALVELRRKKNRSWKHLRRGCLDLLGRPEPWESKKSLADARAFARAASAASGSDYEAILAWVEPKCL